MTKLDFSGVKDVRVGEKEVQRIYRGEAKVWNRYCWEKWSCSRMLITTMTAEATGDSVNVSLGASVGLLSMYKTRYAYTSGEGYYSFSNKIPANTYTFEEAYQKGYVYITDSEKVYTGESYLKITGYVYEGTKKMLVCKKYKVAKTTTASGYIKGSTSYGIVEGLAGDYPDNGRHSDGYWYVRVDPVGIKEE